MIRPKINIGIKKAALPLSKCLAKTVKIDEKKDLKGVDVSTHCMIAGFVARELISRQPEWLRNSLFPKGSELVAAAHDLGKVSPHFQEKIYSAIGLKLGIGNVESDNSLGGHAVISQACLQDIAPNFIPQILGRHHGSSPTSVESPDAAIYGGIEWQKNRMKLLEDLKNCFDCDWPQIQDENQATVLSGLTCVADWIASGSIFDGILPDGHSDIIPWSSRIGEAVDRAGFVGFNLQAHLTFEEIFSFKPREVQRRLYQVANRPGVYILEAPMGIGKTEAALYAAYQALEQNSATGIYFALPTQLTSDKIYDRMNKFLEKILASDCKFRSLLLHSSAWLRDTELGEEGMPGNGWFNSKKRGLLAPFAVGTIDQALMGVMNIKHGFVRSFGLAGKVVILDEVHTYDSYTGTIMDKLVQTLREINCTVIILSATLTSEKRAILLGQKDDETDYPLISALPKGGRSSYLPVTQADSSAVSVFIKNEDSLALEEALLRAERGEQILWIENIVTEAQERFKKIAARAQECGSKIECGLLHSRFQRIDRKCNEEKWVKSFGKDGQTERKKCGRILVGTQVLEQSLDIDADFLITRICPTDMLFQRIGRLWRHRETDIFRPTEARREAWILAPVLEDSRKESGVWGKGGKVYMPYILYRSLVVWEQKKTLLLPQDIRPMLEATYVDQAETGILNKCKENVISNQLRLSGLARIGLSTGGKTLPESKASTRYSEMESCEVLLVRKIESYDSGTTLKLLNGEKIQLPTNAKSKGARKWRELAAELQKNVVLVPEYLAPQTSVRQIEWLKDYVYIGNYEESPFRVAIVQEDGVLSGIDRGNPLPNYELSYTPILGYVARKLDNNGSPEDLW
jgi:CRISPR-associated endonuclease/helicase Cas3